jgi:protein involved in polysaccharide export with SLBB domain
MGGAAMFLGHRPTRAFVIHSLGLLFCVSGFCVSSQAQEQDSRRGTRSSTTFTRPAQLSDLAKENADRVAASAAQVREVLVKDPGILVELKRWVAKEATDNGQVIDDASLTDDAIFARLDRDVAFRSIATRLVQRYGYLLPSANPDSQIGKEQELVLKERARRLVQIEAQEDSDALKPKPDQDGEDRGLERAACSPQRNANCAELPSDRTRTRGTRTRELPEGESNPAVPSEPPPRSSNAQTLRARAEREGGDLTGYDNSALGATLVSDPARRPQDAFSVPGAGSLGGSSRTSRTDALDNLPFTPERPDRNAGMNRSSSAEMAGRTVPLPGGRGMPEKSFESVAMVHRPNPYADIPSLYDMYVQASSRDLPPERFGLELFRNGTREPDAIPMDLPVGPDYVVGPGDGLAIDLWGGVSQRFFRVVDREGRISLPEAGPVLVSGRTLGEVQQSVQQLLRTQFRDISTDVSLSRLRTVRVYVVGDVAEPGAYDISSLSSPLNALFAAGGVTPRGSLRALKHYRGNRLVEEVDAYDLLLRGVRVTPGRLENGDTLVVPPLGPQVTVEGMVRRPAIYELHGETSLEEALELAGGILPAAALQHIEVQRLEAHEKRTMLSLDLQPSADRDAVATQLSSFKIQEGDQIHIFPIAPYNADTIYLQGHVLRPGRYSYRNGMKLADLVTSYKDVLPEPAPHYAEIVRLNPPDFRPSVESFDLASALADPSNSPKLQPLDTVRVFSRYDFEAAPAVWVGGEVRTPGKYNTSGQVHLRDAIFMAGGITPDAAVDSAQLFRTQADGTMKILSVNLHEALSGNPVDNLLLEARDRILVHRNAARVDPPTVDVKGEVAKPGRYPLTANMHVEDLVRVAGGLKRSADSEKADLTRYAAGAPQDSSRSESVPIELSAALGGNTPENIPLRDGDVLTIRQVPGWNDRHASIALQGEVQHPGSYGLRPGERLSSVLARAGGFGPQAYPYGAILTRREVRELETKSHLQLVQRVKSEQASLRALPEGDADQKDAKLTAIAQTETTLQQLETSTPIGRVVIHVKPDMKDWKNTSADVPVRDGDVLFVPKKADYVLVNGQVFNPTAVSFRPGQSAKWYLSQAGGVTPMADKKAVFVIRADGSVIAAKNNNSGWWGGDPLSASLRPGDSIIVPEKAPKVGGRNLATIFQAAQVASSVALAVAYIHP